MIPSMDIINKETNRYGYAKKDEIPFDKMGFSMVSEDDPDHLFNKANKNEVRVIKISSHSYTSMRMEVISKEHQNFSIYAGTLFYPEIKRADIVQTLINLEDIKVELEPGVRKEIILTSSCYNRELAPPKV